jgi:hypothetical protein
VQRSESFTVGTMMMRSLSTTNFYKVLATAFAVAIFLFSKHQPLLYKASFSHH